MRIFVTLSLFLCYQQAYSQAKDPLENFMYIGVTPWHWLMDSTLCDGFDFPVGDKNGTGEYTAPNGKRYNGWKMSDVWKEKRIPLAGYETWNGNGGGDTDLGQPVYAVASGKVVFAGKNIYGQNQVSIEHWFVENGRLKKVSSSYECLGEIKVKCGDLVSRRQNIGSIGKSIDSLGKVQLLFAILAETHMEYASAFIKSHRKVMVPYKKDKIVIVQKCTFKCYLYEKGKLQKTYEIALGQDPHGAKKEQGDLKVPEGEYQICEKTKGPFDTAKNWSAAYLGTRWLCLNYPNNFDAKKALDEKRITQAQFKQIENANKNGVRPPQNTSLGGAIGIHGWIEEDWSNDSDRAQTWGCVSFHNKDREDFYERVDLKTTVIIIP